MLNWRKSRASSDGPTCVEIASTAFTVLVRDSSDPSGAQLAFTSAQWAAFVQHVQSQKPGDG
jgi:hypothetical protein